MAGLFCFVLFSLQLSVCLWWHDYCRDDFPTLKFVVVIADLLAICLREEPFALSGGLAGLFGTTPCPAKLRDTQMHMLDEPFKPGLACHALIGLCKLFDADLLNTTLIAAQPASCRNLNAMVSACNMVLGSPAQAEAANQPLVTVENTRIDRCRQRPDGQSCAGISVPERSDARQLVQVTELHRRARGLATHSSIAACAAAEKLLKCDFSIPHLAQISKLRGGSISNRSTNLLRSLIAISFCTAGDVQLGCISAWRQFSAL